MNTLDIGIPFDQFDFVDFGCSSGGSMEFACGKLGGKRGIGIDIDPSKVQSCRERGYDAAVADVTTLDGLRYPNIRFAVLSHFLEHLASVDLARSCLHSAVSVSEEFVLVRQPFFDADSYLAQLGFRLYWSDWTGHKNHMKSTDFHLILRDLLIRKRIQRYILFFRGKIEDSNNECIHHVSSPRNQGVWEASKHVPKRYINFDVPVYKEVGVLIHTRSRKLPEEPRRFLLSCDVVYDSLV